jgi:hypothetical protein
MLKSQIIEPSSFSQKRVEFSIPQQLCSGMKICDLGVFGPANPAYPLDPVLGQLAVISKIRLLDNGVVLSQYDRRFTNITTYKQLLKNNTKHRCITRSVNANNYGFVVENGGPSSVNVPGTIVGSEAACRPRICTDKKDLSRVFAAQADTKLAILDLRDCLGWCDAVYSSESAQLSAYIPCQLYKNLKLSIEFDLPANVCTGATTIAQPFMIFDSVDSPQVAAAFNGTSAEWVDMELEEVYLGAATSSKRFLNSFYGKKLGNLHLMKSSTAGSVLSPGYGAESINLLVNQVPLFQQSGLDSLGKQVAFTQMALGGDVYSPLTADRVIGGGFVPDKGTSADGSATSVFEGGVSVPFIGASNYYAAGAMNYISMPVQQPITSLQLDYARTVATDASLLFFGEVVKQLAFDSKSNAPVITYAM